MIYKTRDAPPNWIPDLDDADMHRLLELNSYAFNSEIFMISLHVPWIRHVLPSLTGYTKCFQSVYGSMEKIREQIREHQKTLDRDDPRDFIDKYLIEMEENTDPEFNLDQLVMVCHDLMSAGSETVATTMNWVILYLALYTDVQEKCFEEIEDTCVTADGVLNDLEKLHFCKATIAEIQRLSQVAPVSLQHRVFQKV